MPTMNLLKRFFALLALLMLAACGGGGGDSGTSVFGSGSGTGSGTGTGTGGTGSGTSGTPTLTLSISSSNITPKTVATVTAVLLDAKGNAITNKLITLSMTRGNLANLTSTSVATDASGAATTTLQALSSGVTGADEVVGLVTIPGTSGDSVTVTGSVVFRVIGSSATIKAEMSATTLRASAGPATLTATVLDSSGVAVPDQVVSFASANDYITLGAPSGKTDGFGRASTTVQPKDSSLTAADTVSASTTVNGKDVQSSINVQLIGESPLVKLSLSNSNVSQTSPATVGALVRDGGGAPAANVLVSFSTQLGLGVFDETTAATDVTGMATVHLSPKSGGLPGADYVIATATVGGITKSDQAVVQIQTTGSSGSPVLQMALSSKSISSASPATVTTTLTDARGTAVAGQVVAFSVVRGLAKTNIGTALTDVNGNAVVTLAPVNSSSAGADEVTASANYAGTALQTTQGFQIQATNVTIGPLTSATASLSAYGQTTLTLPISGADILSPVNISVSSVCVSLGKATLSPSSFTATGTSITMQYRDNGCGAVQNADQLQAVVVGAAASTSLALPIASPTVTSLAFISAAPETIFLKGSGFTEASSIVFQVRDANSSPLPNVDVSMHLLTLTGGVTMEGGTADVVRASDAQGQVTVRVNSGTLPTPVRVAASIVASPNISTVSSNLGVAVGLPSQLNFSLSQGTRNIEGYNIDGTPNTYQIIAADRSGNPVPSGTTIIFASEGGTVEPSKQTQLVNGIARTAANFVSSEPRPIDGRITVTAYALGEESFLDLNGNNKWDAGEPFQDLGNIFKDRNFDGTYNAAVDEFVPLNIDNSTACVASSGLLALDPSIPSMPGTCDGKWSGAGQVYVRRATETVLSTSGSRPLWLDTSGLASSCQKITLQVGPLTTQTATFTLVAGDVWFGGGSSGTLNFIVADANPGSVSQGLLPRLNPMAAGTTISASTPTSGLSVVVGGGSPVPSTTEASAGSVAYSFTDPAVSSGVIFVNFRSPSGVTTSVSVPVTRTARTTICP
jgi:hypothetical protein